MHSRKPVSDIEPTCVSLDLLVETITFAYVCEWIGEAREGVGNPAGLPIEGKRGGEGVREWRLLVLLLVLYFQYV